MRKRCCSSGRWPSAPIEKQFSDDLDHSDEIHLETLQKRGLRNRIKEKACSGLEGARALRQRSSWWNPGLFGEMQQSTKGPRHRDHQRW